MAYYKKKEPWYAKESDGARRQEGAGKGGSRQNAAEGKARGGKQGKGGGYKKDEKPVKEGRPGTGRRDEERPPRPRQERVEAVQQGEEELPLLLYGRNTVREAVKSGRSIDRLYVVEGGEEDGSLREIVRMARERKLVIAQASSGRLDEMTRPFGYGGKGVNHQGIVAQIPACEYVEVEDILAYARERGEPPFVLVLDSVMDPHNLGSIIRSAECAGVHGIIIPKRRAASVTATVARVSAGAVMYMRLARVPNLSAALQSLKAAGLWIAGADAAGKPMYETDLGGPLALVIGAEGEGISRLVRENCDFLAAAPLKGRVESLNASVAAAVLLYEKLRQDGCAQR